MFVETDKGYELMIQDYNAFEPESVVGLIIKPADIQVMKKERVVNTFEGEIVDETHVKFLGETFECMPHTGLEAGEKVKAMPISELIHLRGAKEIMVTFFCYCALESTAGLWASSFLVLHHGVTEELAASCASLFYIGITVGRALNCHFNAALLKGRANYLCRTRLRRALEQANDLFNQAETKQLYDLLAWSKDCGEGSLAELPQFCTSTDLWKPTIRRNSIRCWLTIRIACSIWVVSRRIRAWKH